jgi:hypothetical protein
MSVPKEGKFIRDEYGRLYPPKRNWVEEELENIKNMPSERVCSSCKWGEKLETRTGFNCHYYPDDIDVAGEHWCSKWTEK